MLYKKSFLKVRKKHEGIEKEYNSLLSSNTQLGQDNHELKKRLEETTALYDLTKNICKYLDEEKVFLNFKEEISKYIEVLDCRLLKSNEDLAPYKEYVLMRLDIDKVQAGYLVARLTNKHDNEKFHILGQQFLLGIKRAILYQRVQELAITDTLSGVFSRRYYLERFKEEIERSQKFNYSFSCLMIDIDHFKNYNDHYGHLVGDAILRELSKTIKENIRQIDLIGRYGGEEFSIILTETDKEQAKFAAERIRHSVESRYIRVYDEDLRVTISIGISTFPGDGKQMEALIDNADSALYYAKQNGRNKVSVFGECNKD
ncbi:MAG: GGDEF domain-containing protein [Candidatus Omnitrophota bacterium]